MLDKSEINTQFFACLPGLNQKEIAHTLRVTPQTVNEWATGSKQVPWEKLKWLSDTKDIRWDWLLEGIGPKERPATLDREPCTNHTFELTAINMRFLEFYQHLSQVELARELNVTPGAVNAWKMFRRRVWKKLAYLHDSKHVSWEWIIEGIEPKYQVEIA